MTQQSPKQKDIDASAKNEQAYGTGPGKVEIPGFKTPDASHAEPRANPNPKTVAARPKVGQTTRNGGAHPKEACPVCENGVVDAPAGRDLSESRADAKRDASSNQMPTLLKADLARDE